MHVSYWPVFVYVSRCSISSDFFVHLVNEKEVTASVWPRKECDTQKCGTHIRGAIGNWTWLAADISCFSYWSHLMTDKCQGNPGMARLSAVWTLAVAASEEPTYYLVKTTADIAEIIIIIKYMYTISNILIKIVFFVFFSTKSRSLWISVSLLNSML